MSSKIAPEMQTVDVQINEDVLHAARLRVQLIQGEEIRMYGRPRTHLPDVARDILSEWPSEPHELVPKSKRRPRFTRSIKDKCPVCGKQITVNASGSFRTHGPENNRCEGSLAQSPKRKLNPPPTFKPLRFDMPRDRYQRIRQEIHEFGETVAGLLTKRLTEFAKTGKY